MVVLALEKRYFTLLHDYHDMLARFVRLLLLNLHGRCFHCLLRLLIATRVILSLFQNLSTSSAICVLLFLILFPYSLCLSVVIVGSTSYYPGVLSA